MEIRDTLPAEVHRWLLMLAIAGSALLYGPPGGLDAGNASKATVIMVAGLLALLVAGVAVIRERAAGVVWHPAVALAVAFGAALAVRGFATDPSLVAFVGPVGRVNGVGMYLACIVLFLVAAARSDERTWSFVATTALVVGAVVALSAIDEATLRLGPDWAQRPNVAGTLGNSNFLGGWSGVVVPLTLAAALESRRSWVRRGVAIVVTLLLLYAVHLSGAFQGRVVVGAGVLVLLLVWAHEQLPLARWRAVAAGAGALAILGAGIVSVGIAGIGPMSSLGDQPSVQLRGHYWVAASRMWQDAPLTGVGPGGYIEEYRLVRTPEAAAMVDLSSTSDSAHNVVLQHLAEGGLILALLYVAVLGAILLAFLTALRRHTGPRRLWVGAFGAAWIGYVLQAMVSIDVPQLAGLGWILGGLLVGAAAGDRRFGTPPGKRGDPRLTGAVQAGVGVGLLVLGTVGTWAATLPYRADATSSRATVTNQRTPDVGRAATSTAIELAPWREAYHLQLVRALADRDEVERAAGVAERALQRHPRSFEAALNAARLAVRDDDLDLAFERYERARELEPLHADLAAEMARVAFQRGDRETTRQLLDEALEVDPDHEEARQMLDEL